MAHLEAVTELLREAAGRGYRPGGAAGVPQHDGRPAAARGRYRAAAETLDGPFTTTVRGLAETLRLAVVLPIYRLDEAGRLRNTAVVIDRRGRITGCYDKVHPTRNEMSPKGVVAGDGWPVFALESGRLGVMICHDNSFVESARCLALEGAEVIAWPHVQSGWGDVVWDITLRSRAIDNGVYLVSSCYAVRGEGAWRPGLMVGRSGVVGRGRGGAGRDEPRGGGGHGDGRPRPAAPGAQLDAGGRVPLRRGVPGRPPAGHLRRAHAAGAGAGRAGTPTARPRPPLRWPARSGRRARPPTPAARSGRASRR